MRKTKLLLTASLFLISTVLLSISSSSVHASIIDNLKDFFNQDEDKNVKNKEFTIDSQIELVPEGDENKNGEIDAGDIVRFTYTLTNTTDKAYSYATLKTNINRKQLNFIHSLRGATGLSDDKDTIIFRNVRLGPNEQRIISFEARVNYSQEDKVIASEPEFVSSDNKPVGKFQRKEITAKKLSKEEIAKRLESLQQVIKKRSEKMIEQ